MKTDILSRFALVTQVSDLRAILRPGVSDPSSSAAGSPKDGRESPEQPQPARQRQRSAGAQRHSGAPSKCRPAAGSGSDAGGGGEKMAAKRSNAKKATVIQPRVDISAFATKRAAAIERSKLLREDAHDHRHRIDAGRAALDAGAAEPRAQQPKSQPAKGGKPEKKRTSASKAAQIAPKVDISDFATKRTAALERAKQVIQACTRAPKCQLRASIAAISSASAAAGGFVPQWARLRTRRNSALLLPRLQSPCWRD